MAEEIIDSKTTVNIAASERNPRELTVLESECWGTDRDESSKHGTKPINEDASQKYLVQTSNFNVSFIYEEQILDSVFQACDVEERGIVPAFQIIGYLKSVTDPSRDENRLQTLSNLLDPEGQNNLVDLLTFRKTMSRWIESCWMESSQQAMQHARSVCNELEDTKIFVTNLEDKMSVVVAQLKQLEKDELLLNNQKKKLQEENDKLLSQNEKVKEKLDSLRVENFKLLQQLDEYENLLVQKDEILTQELKNEKNDLQEELLQIHADIAIQSSLSHKHPSSFLSVWSVRNEIEEIQESSSNPNLQLPDPACHTSDCSVEMEKIDENIWTDTETKLIQLKLEVDMLLTNLHQITSGQQATYLEEESAILLKGLSCLTHLKCAWETYVSKINGAKKINTKNKLSLSQNTRLSTEWSLLPVNNQLAVHQRQWQRIQDAISSGDCITWLFPEIGCLLTSLLRKLRPYFSTRKLLLTISLYILIIFMWSGENICTIISMTLWPHLKLLHLKPPPM